MRRFGIKLSLKLPGLVIVGALSTGLATGLLAIFIGRQVIRERTLEANINSVKSYASAVSFYIDNARSVLDLTAERSGSTFVSSPRIMKSGRRKQPDEPASMIREMASDVLTHSKVFEFVMFLGADGVVQLVEPHDLESKLSRPDVNFTEWYKKLMSTGKTVISDLGISTVTQRPTVIVATPVMGAEGKIYGIWAGGLELEELSKIGHGDTEPGELHRYGYITDSRGLIIAHQAYPKYVLEQTDFSSVPAVQAALRGQQGSGQWFNPLEGSERLGAYTPLPSLGWAVVYVEPIQSAFAPIHQLTLNIILASAGLSVLLGFIGWLLARQIVKPLGRLAVAAQTIREGDLSGGIEVHTGDEVELLADEFNRMSAALLENQQQLSQRAEQLEQANKELEAFSYSVSHDLRAPLRAIDGFSRILLEEYVAQLSPEAQRYLGLVRQNTRQMGNLIDDLLAFSRLSRQPLKKQSVAPADLARQSFQALQAEQKGRQVDLVIGNLPACEADPSLLKQVWMNLLSNALKFTRKREAARIAIGSQNNGDENIYYVKDNGVGFDMQYAHKLFGVFQRLHRAEEYEGTGVGLAIVQRIIQRHGGQVWAEAELDKGATFYFTLEGGSNERQAG